MWHVSLTVPDLHGRIGERDLRKDPRERSKMIYRDLREWLLSPGAGA